MIFRWLSPSFRPIFKIYNFLWYSVPKLPCFVSICILYFPSPLLRDRFPLLCLPALTHWFHPDQFCWWGFFFLWDFKLFLFDLLIFFISTIVCFFLFSLLNWIFMPLINLAFHLDLCFCPSLRYLNIAMIVLLNSVWRVFLVVFIGIHYYRISNFGGGLGHVVLFLHVTLFLFWALRIWTILLVIALCLFLLIIFSSV